MKLYIDTDSDNGGEGVYYLMTENGEVLASHYCSSAAYAKGDLEARRPERQEKYRERFGEYQVLFVGDDEMTSEELQRRNEALFEQDK